MIERTSRGTVDTLARDHGLELLRFAYLLCGDRQLAEDLVQDVLLALHRRFPSSLPLSNPMGYARRALANANVSRARRRSSSELVVDEVPAGRAPDDAGSAADRDVLWQALRRPPASAPSSSCGSTPTGPTTTLPSPWARGAGRSAASPPARWPSCGPIRP